MKKKAVKPNSRREIWKFFYSNLEHSKDILVGLVLVYIVAYIVMVIMAGGYHFGLSLLFFNDNLLLMIILVSWSFVLLFYFDFERRLKQSGLHKNYFRDHIHYVVDSFFESLFIIEIISYCFSIMIGLYFYNEIGYEAYRDLSLFFLYPVMLVVIPLLVLLKVFLTRSVEFIPDWWANPKLRKKIIYQTTSPYPNVRRHTVLTIISDVPNLAMDIEMMNILTTLGNEDPDKDVRTTVRSYASNIPRWWKNQSMREQIAQNVINTQDPDIREHLVDEIASIADWWNYSEIRNVIVEIASEDDSEEVRELAQRYLERIPIDFRLS